MSCVERFSKLFEKMVVCKLCFPMKGDKRTWIGHGNVEHPCDAELLFLGESPSPHRDFNETFGMKSKPAFNAFKNHLFYLLGTEMKWWAMNVNNCNMPSVGLTADLREVRCMYFNELLETLSSGNLKYIVSFGRLTSNVVTGLDVPLSGRPVSKRVGSKVIVVFPVRHPMAHVRNNDSVGPILDAESVATYMKTSLMRWIK